MNINATLIAQAIMFALFVWFCMSFVWPPIVGALAARQKQIADGLAAADRGKHELEASAKTAALELRAAKEKATEIIGQAEKRASEIVEESKIQEMRWPLGRICWAWLQLWLIMSR